MGDYDCIFWSSAAKIKGIIGGKNHHIFEVINFCNSGNLGIHNLPKYIADRF